MINSSAFDGVDLVCFSHLRWNFVFQRPQHLLTRCARERRCFYVEEPLYDASGGGRMDVERCGGVTVCVPHLPTGGAPEQEIVMLRGLLDKLFARERIDQYVSWYYNPMALAFTEHLDPRAIVFDCMDELSAFANAPAALRSFEADLLRRADVVFTGGHSLYQSKRDKHPNVHELPSSVDVAHFAQALRPAATPADQAAIPAPRLGFFGVLDERLDIPLVTGLASARPDWHIVLIGPVVKIDPASLPQAPNIHYLGSKPYGDLPQYIGGWDVALLPFARNRSTEFISPTKTPEYLAAGRPVVSTSIRDVVHPYGRRGLVRIADTPPSFVAACEAALAEDPAVRRRAADEFLRHMSWDDTWARMRGLVAEALTNNGAPTNNADVASAADGLSIAGA
jgi:UDP-galactopyranose mutase